MNNKYSTWLALAVLAMVCWACSPDSVKPQSQTSDKPIDLLADAGAHPSLNPVCSPEVTHSLSDATGNLFVNYSGNGPTGTGTGSQVPWGNMVMYNGMDEAGQEILALEFTLASGWYIRHASVYCGDASYLQIGPNGVPLINSSWTVKPVNPVINAYQVRVVLDGMATTNTVLARLEVGMLDWALFDGSLDQNSVTELWAWNGEFNDSSSPLASASPLQMPWTTIWCNPPSPQDVTLTDGDCRGCESENTVTFHGDCKQIDVESCKDLSNVVLVFDDCEWQKFDGLNGRTGSFSGTGTNADKSISHAYIKSGCFKSGEGPGFGRRFDGPCLNTACATN